jgi:hypothetical protein
MAIKKERVAFLSTDRIGHLNDLVLTVCETSVDASAQLQERLFEKSEVQKGELTMTVLFLPDAHWSVLQCLTKL